MSAPSDALTTEGYPLTAEAEIDWTSTEDTHCEWSFLRKEWCAGPCCLDLYIDPDLLEANKP